MASALNVPGPGALPPARGGLVTSFPRVVTILVTATAVLSPLSLILYQSFLSAPFFESGKTVSLDAYRFVLEEADFWLALRNSLMIAAGMTLIAVPLGGLLAFLMERTNLPGKRWLEPLILVPSFVSPMVLSFGYVVAAGPVGFFTVWTQDTFGVAPWGIYSLAALSVIAGLTHVPNVYVYASSALKSLGSDFEEAARIAGASPFRVAATASLPLIMPSLLVASVLVFFLGIELFGLPLVLGDPEGHLVLSTYLYKLTNKLGVPSYHLMAAVAICIVAMTIPLVLLQRKLLQNARKYATIKGKAGRIRELPLGKWKWFAVALLVFWLFVAVIVPISGIALRAFVNNWGFGVSLVEAFTLDNFRAVFDEPTHVRAIWNTILIGTVGGAITVACYTAIGFATHRRNDGWSRVVDYLVLVPRAVPGLLIGLAFLWVFLFFPPLAPGTEVIGAQLVSLWQGGAIDVVAALSLINIVLVFIGLAFALRFGVKLRD